MENHLDPFFKGKLATHETAFSEEHWLQMQGLLKEKKRKKRRLFFWMALVTMLLGGIALWWIGGTHKASEQKLVESKKTNIAESNKSSVAEGASITVKPKAVVEASEEVMTPNVTSTPQELPGSGSSKNLRSAPATKSQSQQSRLNENPDHPAKKILTTGILPVPETTASDNSFSKEDSPFSNQNLFPASTYSEGTGSNTQTISLEQLVSKSFTTLAADEKPLLLNAPELRKATVKHPFEYYAGAGTVWSNSGFSKPGIRLETGAMKQFRHLGIWSLGAGIEWWGHSPAAGARTVNEVQYGFGRTEYTYELKTTNLRAVYTQLLWHVRLARWHFHLGPQLRYLPVQKSNLNTYTKSSLAPQSTLLRSQQGFQTTEELQLRSWIPGAQSGIQFRWKNWELSGAVIWMKGSWLSPVNDAMEAPHTFTFQSQIRYYFKWNK